jgi:hypothetical protein
MSECLFSTNLLQVSTQVVADLIHHFDYPVDVKDARNWKYILSNSAASEVSGLSPDERRGMDIHDIARINRIKETAVQKVVRADYQVVEKAESVNFHHVFLRKDGVLVVDKVIKKPIFGQSGTPLAVLSYAYGITRQIELASLYKFYRSYYSTKQAIQYFLQHVCLDNEFQVPPTDRELKVLLVMQNYIVASKHVARLMQLSPRTVEEYKSRLRYKLKRITFDELLLKLRTYNQYDNIIF